MMEVYTRMRDLRTAPESDDKCPHQQLARCVIQQAIKDLRTPEFKDSAIDFLLGLDSYKESHALWFGMYLGRNPPDSLADVERGAAHYFNDERHTHEPRKAPESETSIKARIVELKQRLSCIDDLDARKKLRTQIETQARKLRKRKAKDGAA